MSKKLEKFNFEYEFVPMMVSSANDDPRTEPMLTTKQVWQRIFDRAGYETVNFTFDDISVTRNIISPNVSLVVYTFPEVDRDGLAKYGIVVIDTHGKNSYRYFTMEKPYSYGEVIEDSLWFIVEQKGDNRINYNPHTINKLEEFVQKVIDICYNGQIKANFEKIQEKSIIPEHKLQHEGISEDRSSLEMRKEETNSHSKSNGIWEWIKNLFG